MNILKHRVTVGDHFATAYTRDQDDALEVEGRWQTRDYATALRDALTAALDAQRPDPAPRRFVVLQDGPRGAGLPSPGTHRAGDIVRPSGHVTLSRDVQTHHPDHGYWYIDPAQLHEVDTPVQHDGDLKPGWYVVVASQPSHKDDSPPHFDLGDRVEVRRRPGIGKDDGGGVRAWTADGSDWWAINADQLARMTVQPEPGVSPEPESDNLTGHALGYFRRPDVPGQEYHDECGVLWDEHGWIDALDVIVCPSATGPFAGQSVTEEGRTSREPEPDGTLAHLRPGDPVPAGLYDVAEGATTPNGRGGEQPSRVAGERVRVAEGVEVLKDGSIECLFADAWGTRRFHPLARFLTPVAEPEPEPTWRVGRSVGRTIYQGDVLVGVMDTPELAGMVVAALNGGEDR